MATILLNGARLHVRCDGERGRPTVLLSNSLGTDLSMWDAQAAILATRFHVVRYDTRGHGASETTPGPYSIAQLGADVLALLDHLDIARAHFVGLSMGGVIGQWLGIHAPGRSPSSTRRRRRPGERNQHREEAGGHAGGGPVGQEPPPALLPPVRCRTCLPFMTGLLHACLRGWGRVRPRGRPTPPA